MADQIAEEGLEDVYSDFDEDLEDDEMSPEEVAFMRGYLDEED